MNFSRVVDLFGYHKILGYVKQSKEQAAEPEPPNNEDADAGAEPGADADAVADNDSDATMLSEDEDGEVLGYESDRSVDEEPTTEDEAFLDDEEVSDEDGNHAALLNQAREEDFDDQDADRMLRYFHLKY